MSAWTFPDLQADQLELVREAERTLSADVVLAFAPLDEGGPDAEDDPGLRPAALSDSELECLQGLEQVLHTVLVAYRV